MRIKQLRELIDNYKKKHRTRIAFTGGHERAKKLEEFVALFSEIEDGEQLLKPQDEFNLASLLITMPDDISLVRNFKALFNHHNVFFRLFKLKIVTADNYEYIQELDSEKMSLVYNLCDLTGSTLCVNIIIPLIAAKNSVADINKLFNLLRTNQLLSEKIFEWIGGYPSHLSAVIEVLQAFVDASTLSIFDGQTYPRYPVQWASLLKTMKSAGITLNHDLIGLIDKNNALNEVDTICQAILDSQCRLEVDALKQILLIQEPYISNLRDGIKRLQACQLITPYNLRVLLATDGRYYLINILRLLDDATLKANSEALLNSKYKYFDIHERLLWLVKLHLLNNTMIKFVIEGNISDRYKDILEKLVARPLFKITEDSLKDIAVRGWSCIEILHLLIDANLVSDELVKRLLKLNADYYSRFLVILRNLKDHGLLTAANLDAVFDKMENKIEKATVENFVAETKTEGQDSYAVYTSAQKEYQFFSKDSLLPINAGQKKLVNEVTTKAGSQEYHYALARFPNDTKSMGVNRWAKKEAKYLKFVGREVHLFKKDDESCVIAENKGTKLSCLGNVDYFGKLNIEVRLSYLINLLTELCKLHRAYRVHGNINLETCIFANEGIKLSNFESARKVKNKEESLPSTAKCLDRGMTFMSDPTNSYGFCDDVYTAGLVAASLFPDLFTVHLTQTNKIEKRNGTPYTLRETAIDHLISAMLCDDRAMRCTALNALSYCKKLKDELSNLDKPRLESITATYLTNSKLSFEDIICDHRAAFKMS